MILNVVQNGALVARRVQNTIAVADGVKKVIEFLDGILEKDKKLQVNEYFVAFERLVKMQVWV